jgi:archaetidylinositol phosphate synthase
VYSAPQGQWDKSDEPIFRWNAHYWVEQIKPVIGGNSMSTCAVPLHKRELISLLASPEKRALTWLAQHTPDCINSDHLTILGFIGMLLAGFCYGAGSWNRGMLLLVIPALAINWYGDSLDGTLARVRNKQRPRYGYYTDHVLDILGTSVLMAGLAISGLMTPLLALGVLCAFLMTAAEAFLATHVRKVFKMAFLSFGPTELRIVLAVGTLYAFNHSHVALGSHGEVLLFDVGGVVAIAGLLLAFMASAVRNIGALYREEPL